MGALIKNRGVCLNRHKDGFLDRSGCPNRKILINSMRFSEINSERENIQTFETFEINIWVMCRWKNIEKCMKFSLNRNNIGISDCSGHLCSVCYVLTKHTQDSSCVCIATAQMPNISVLGKEQV